MTGRTTLEMAREAGLYVHKEVQPEIRRFEELIRADEAAKWMQLFTDPENQPTQHGTVTVEYIRREIDALSFKRLCPDDTEGGER